MYYTRLKLYEKKNIPIEDAILTVAVVGLIRKKMQNPKKRKMRYFVII